MNFPPFNHETLPAFGTDGAKLPALGADGALVTLRASEQGWVN